MYLTIMKIKNHKKLTNLSFKIFLKKLFFRIYNYMSKIFPKIYLKFDLKYFHSIVFKVLFVTKQRNNNKYYSTISCNHCNTYSYSYVITITAYPTYPYFFG